MDYQTINNSGENDEAKGLQNPLSGQSILYSSYKFVIKFSFIQMSL